MKEPRKLVEEVLQILGELQMPDKASDYNDYVIENLQQEVFLAMSLLEDALKNPKLV